MIRTVIVDDEQPSLDKLEKLLRESGLAEVAGKFTEPVEALAFVGKNNVDAAFLDIEMPDVDGIELATRFLGLQGNMAVVFVTAYNQYAVEAFRLNALDYLMKPVAGERLRETLCRIGEKKNISAVDTEKLQVSCFGGFSVRAGDAEVKFRTEKAEELLAFLIDKRGGFVSRREILDSLWEDFDGDRALIHFNTTLHYVKKALLRYGIRLSPTYDRGGYRFDIESLDCDYLKFCTFAENTGAAAQENIPGYEAAAGLYAGEYLYGLEYGWVERKRLLLEEQYIALLLGIAGYYKAAGDCKKASKWLEAGLLREPLHRELNYRLVEVLLLANERMLASKHYELYRNGLRKRLSEEPDEAFNKLLHWDRHL